MFFSLSKLLFHHFIDLSTYIICHFYMPCVSNVLQTVRFPFTVAHEIYEMFTKLEWLVNGVFILLTVRTHNVQNIHEA